MNLLSHLIGSTVTTILLLLAFMFVCNFSTWLDIVIIKYRTKRQKMRHSLKQKLCTGNYIADKKYIGDSRYIILYKKNDFFSFLRSWKEYTNGEYSDFTRKYANQFIKKVNK